MATEPNTPDRPIVTRAEAIALGLKRYFDGRPCRRGHVAEHLISSRKCLICNAIDVNAMRKASPEKERARHVELWKRHRARKLAKRAALRKENYEVRERQNTAAMAHYFAKRRLSPEVFRVRHQLRRARMMAAEGSFSASDIADIRRLQRDRCAICRCRLNGKETIDHIVALINGGSNRRSNLQLVCKSCNSSKKDRHPIAFMQSRGLLL